MTTESEALFSTTNNLQMIIICLIGGVGTLWGPWIGAFVLFGLFMPDEGAPDRWDLVVSASWLPADDLEAARRSRRTGLRRWSLGR